jgi:hypothetical protein
MYLGNQQGVIITAEQELWYNGRDRLKEEEEFLAELVTKMVGLFGKFDCKAFKWALRDEQARRGSAYETFWKDREYSAIAD